MIQTQHCQICVHKTTVEVAS